MLLHQPKQPRPTAGHAEHQARHGLVLTNAANRPGEEIKGKVEVEEVDEAKVENSGHRRRSPHGRPRPLQSKGWGVSMRAARPGAELRRARRVPATRTTGTRLSSVPR